MKFTPMKKQGFTLLELIIVIIILGVLASLALPRLYLIIEVSRSGEALSMFSVIRKKFEQCHMMQGEYNTQCLTYAISDSGIPWANMMDLPGLGIGSEYSFGYIATITTDNNGFQIQAHRSGDAPLVNKILFRQHESFPQVSIICGCGTFRLVTPGDDVDLCRSIFSTCQGL